MAFTRRKMKNSEAIRDGVPKWLFSTLGPWALGCIVGFLLFPVVNEHFGLFPQEAQGPFALATGMMAQAIYLLLRNTLLNKVLLTLAAGLAAYSATGSTVIGTAVSGIMIIGMIVLALLKKPDPKVPTEGRPSPDPTSGVKNENEEVEREGEAVAVTTTVGLPGGRTGRLSNSDLIKIATEFDGEPIAENALIELSSRLNRHNTGCEDDPIQGQAVKKTVEKKHIRRC